MIPPALWNACDFVLQNNFVSARVARSMNTAADFLSSTEVDPSEKIKMTIRNVVHTKAIEASSQSSGIVEEVQSYVLPGHEFDKNQFSEETQTVRNQPQTETHNDTTNAASELKQVHKPASGFHAPQDTSRTTQESDLSKTTS